MAKECRHSRKVFQNAEIVLMATDFQLMVNVKNVNQIAKFVYFLMSLTA